MAKDRICERIGCPLGDIPGTCGLRGRESKPLVQRNLTTTPGRDELAGMCSRKWEPGKKFHLYAAPASDAKREDKKRRGNPS